MFFYVLPRASYGYIRCGFIASAVWRFSNIFFQLFRCRNLALNRFFCYFLVVGMFFYLGGVWTPPCQYAPYICMPPVHLHTPQGCTHTPIGPIALLCICMVLEHFHVVGGCYQLKCVLGQLPCTSPIWGCLPLIYTPHTSLLVPCTLLFSGILVSYVGLSLSIEGFGCVPPSLGEVWGHISSLAVHMLILVLFL